MKTRASLAIKLILGLTFIFLSTALAQPNTPELNPAKGDEIGWTFEAFLSPMQQSGDEEDTPAIIPNQFRSTTPSLSREERVANGHRGHGVIRFTRDLSKAYVDVMVEGTDTDTVAMFHLHCELAGLFGPILVDFALATDIRENFSDGVFSVVVDNDLIVETASSGSNMVTAFSTGCPIPVTRPRQVSTVAGMLEVAQRGELYFNLHTTGQFYYGDLRGQLYPVE
ncbi:MAG: CHRD domain-containing protein [Deinococcota bacterium]